MSTDTVSTLTHQNIATTATNNKQRKHMSVLSINVETETLLKPDLEAKISSNYRLSSIDMFKGLIMILMVLDHSWGIISPRTDVEWWFGQNKTVYTIYGNNDIELAHCVFFMIRFVTKLCAPGFFMMLGFGMVYFYQHRYMKFYWKHRYLMKYLLLRSILIMLIGFVFDFIFFIFYRRNNKYQIGIDVLTSLGINMMLMTPFISMEFRLYYQHSEYHKSFLVYLIILIIAIFSTATEIPSHDKGTDGKHHALATILYYGHESLNGVFYIYWPIIPWLQFTAIGCLMARFIIHAGIIKINPYKILFIFTFLCWLLFVVIRSIGDFGNFGYKWNGNYSDGSAQTPWLVINYFNVTFSSPSLSTLTLYTFINVFILCFVHFIGWCDDIIRIFGNTSLFFYVIHVLILIAVDKIWSVLNIKYKHTSWIAFASTFVLWITVVIIMYPLCKLYHKFKTKKIYTSVWRMF